MQARVHVLVAGSSGFLGTHLCRHLRARGHRVTTLVRREPGGEEIQWDPYLNRLAPEWTWWSTLPGRH